jgi:hypothetical protein
MQWGPPLRVVPPVFNMINQGGRGSANTRFVVKDKFMFDLIMREEEKAPVVVPCLVRICSVGGGRGGGEGGVEGGGGGGVQVRREPRDSQGSKQGGSQR